MAGRAISSGRISKRNIRRSRRDPMSWLPRGSDPVTQDKDIMYFLTKSPAWATRIVKTLDGARLVQ